MIRTKLLRPREGAGKGSAMFVDVGARRALPISGVVGIFDLDAVTESETGREFLRAAESRCATVTVSRALPKSFVLYDDGVGETVYLSPFNTRALQGRSKG